MRRVITIFIICIFGGIVAILLLFIAVVWVAECRPAVREVVFEKDSEAAMLPDTLKILTWNTGYAGLGADMDFFMDGGKRTRTSREQTAENLDAIARFLAESGADIILLQEVDRDSRRSFHTDQFAAYQRALPGYHGYFALNYRSPFVPVPWRAPMGQVESGVALFSKVRPQEVVRYQYNSRFSFPVRLFN